MQLIGNMHFAEKYNVHVSPGEEFLLYHRKGYIKIEETFLD